MVTRQYCLGKRCAVGVQHANFCGAYLNADKVPEHVEQHMHDSWGQELDSFPKKEQDCNIIRWPLEHVLHVHVSGPLAEAKGCLHEVERSNLSFNGSLCLDSRTINKSHNSWYEHDLPSNFGGVCVYVHEHTNWTDVGEGKNHQKPLRPYAVVLCQSHQSTYIDQRSWHFLQALMRNRLTDREYSHHVLLHTHIRKRAGMRRQALHCSCTREGVYTTGAMEQTC